MLPLFSLKALQVQLPKILTLLFLSGYIVSCNQGKQKKPSDNIQKEASNAEDLFFKVSLAQWSLHEPIQDGELDPMDFAEKASELGFDGIEYVNQFYSDRINQAEDPEAEMQEVLNILKKKSEEFGVQNVLIMVDGEGDLAADNETVRNQAVENHKKWVDAAQFLGCKSIRVNLYGSNEVETWKANSIDALTKLSSYAGEKNINVLVENHGNLSSDGQLVAEVMKQVNLPNCGTLPDFGNFCIERGGEQNWQNRCLKEYPRYKGIREMMPYAKGVSAKSYDFNEAGEETTIDYSRMLQIVKDAGYTGFIGVEYEGVRLPPEEGIRATRELLIEEGRKL